MHAVRAHETMQAVAQVLEAGLAAKQYSQKPSAREKTMA
jgi:hypothetical protein